MSAEERRSRSEERYWRALRRLGVHDRTPWDRYADRLLGLAPGSRWLDAGCGRSSVPPWRSDLETHLREAGVVRFGCDLDRPALASRPRSDLLAVASLAQLPYADSAFDYVSSNMVFEHLDDPDAAVREIVRVTRPGGRILIHTVNARHYLSLAARATPFSLHRWVVSRVEGRPPEDVFPTRYRANTTAALESLFRRHGCDRTFGGELSDLPLHVPYPGLFWLGLALGLAERRLARSARLGSPARPNLLLEFERRSGAAAPC